MSTLRAFRETSGITQTMALEITPERAQQIIQTVCSNHREQADSIPVNILPVSTYVAQSKEEHAGSAYVYPKQPPFASHWGIVVGDINQKGEANLFHLVLSGDGAEREIRFRAPDIELDSKWIRGAAVKHVGETRFTVPQLRRIGAEMIAAFGNYHLVFWNCQMFAKCYLRVITGSDLAFSQWTSADVTNLFLCSLIIPMPIASSSRINEKRKMRELRQVGKQATKEQALDNEGRRPDLVEENLFRLSDELIDLMMESWRDDETLKKLSRPLKDSADKPGLLSGIKSWMLKMVGYSHELDSSK
jgi:hypothetical protein